jgi:RNA polymerase sigma factor (sigma-70 family)
LQTNEVFFEALYTDHHKMVYNLSLGYVQNAEDAQEITQDVFVEVFHALGKFKGESSPKTWIYRITINKSLDFIKYKKRKKRSGLMQSIFSNTGEQIQIPDLQHPGVTLENKEKAAVLFGAINNLPEHQKTAFLMSKMEGIGNAEIGVVLGKSIGAIESLLSRAKESLKKQLEKYYHH